MNNTDRTFSRVMQPADKLVSGSQFLIVLLMHQIKPPCMNLGHKYKIPSVSVLYAFAAHRDRAAVALVFHVQTDAFSLNKRDGSIVVTLSPCAINQGTLRSMQNNFNRFIQTVPHN